MLAFPTTTPSKAVKVLNLRLSVDHFEHLTGTYIYAFSATGAFIFVNKKVCFILLHAISIFIELLISRESGGEGRTTF
jgi:hypothetical protein